MKKSPRLTAIFISLAYIGAAIFSGISLGRDYFRAHKEKASLASVTTTLKQDCLGKDKNGYHYATEQGEFWVHNLIVPNESSAFLLHQGDEASFLYDASDNNRVYELTFDGAKLVSYEDAVGKLQRQNNINLIIIPSVFVAFPILLWLIMRFAKSRMGRLSTVPTTYQNRAVLEEDIDITAKQGFFQNLTENSGAFHGSFSKILQKENHDATIVSILYQWLNEEDFQLLIETEGSNMAYVCYRHGECLGFEVCFRDKHNGVFYVNKNLTWYFPLLIAASKEANDAYVAAIVAYQKSHPNVVDFEMA